LVTSLDHPGGNVTGISVFLAELAAKRFGLLLELIPSAKSIGFLYNPTNPVFAESERKQIQAVADGLRLRLLPVAVSNTSETETAFKHLVEEGADALFVSSDGSLFSQGDQIAALAENRRLPAVYGWGEVPNSALMNYGADFHKHWRQAGVYVGRILKGERPSDLPVIQPTSLELTINLKAAKALGLTVPLPLLGRANDVIE
jgi:putative tryptophan/tyrosine transport system substrate-binding protein